MLFLIGLCLSIMGRGSLSQNPLCAISVTNGLIVSPVGGSILIDANLDTDPVCIRCGTFGVLYTQIDEVDYFFSGMIVTAATPGFQLTNDGLIVDNPANVFIDGQQGFCVVSSQSINNLITVNFLVFKSPSITPDSSKLNITEGDSATLTCTRDPTNTISDQYRWTLPNDGVSPPQPASSPLDLKLAVVNRDQSGLYVCTGTRPGTAKTVNATITIIVHYPPIVLSFIPTNTTVVAGSTVTLNCTFEGNPSPTVSWSHNGTVLNIESDPHISDTLNIGYALLEVTFVDINDTGEYKCEVENTIDTDSSELYFPTVQVAPSPVATLQNDSITDVCITLSWSFGFDGNAPITGVDITYMATSNYDMSQDGDQAGIVSTSTEDTISITICNLQPLTTYEFSVLVKNTVSGTVGRSSAQTLILTTLPLVAFFNFPSITPDTSQLNISEGVNATLTCTSDPSNTRNDVYQWILPNGDVSPPQPASSPLDLKLTVVNRDQSGLYVCTGTRPGTAKTVNVSITIFVHYPPKVLSFTPTYNTTLVVAGSTVTLNCTFEGNPSPTVSWSHNGTVLNIESDPHISDTLNIGYALLEVTFVDINDTGEYKCEIENTIDTDSSELYFPTVQVAPSPVATLQNDSITDVCITLSWSFGFDGNAPITGVDITYMATSNYDMSQDGDQAGIVSTSTEDTISITICNLQPFTTYEFSVLVKNTVSGTVGRSSAQTLILTTLPLVPNQATIVSTEVISSTTLRVSWIATINAFTQTAISRYNIRYRNVVSNSTVNHVEVMNGQSTTQLLSSLMKGTTYEITIVLVNTAGESLASEPMQQTTAVDPPGPVTNLLPTSNPFSICIQWAEPTCNGGQPIEQYRVELWNRDEYQTENFVFVTDLVSTVRTYTIENLDNHIDYSVRVSASNKEAEFGTTDTVNITTGVALLVDPNFLVSVSNITIISAQVDWTVPNVNDNIQYRLQIKEKDDSDFNPDQYTNFTSNAQTAYLTNLSPNTKYDLRMTRIEGRGCIRRVSNIKDFETLGITCISQVSNSTQMSTASTSSSLITLPSTTASANTNSIAAIAISTTAFLVVFITITSLVLVVMCIRTMKSKKHALVMITPNPDYETVFENTRI